MNEKKDVVVIGGGAAGLGVAYHLMKKGLKNVVVLEKGYIGAGISGRSLGSVLAQWSTQDEIILAREGVKILENLSGALKFNIMFSQGGSLILAHTPEEVEQLRGDVKMQNLLKVRSKFVGPGEVKKIVPMLDADKILGASLCPSGGTLYPYALLWGYTQALRRGGVEVRSFTEARSVKVENGEVTAVVTNKDEIKTSTVVNAAGAHSAEIAKMAGVKLPNEPRKLEFLVAESLKPFLNPLIISPRHGVHIAQTMRGEIICGMSDPRWTATQNMRSSIEFLRNAAGAMVEIVPQFGHLKVVRQWSGLYDSTPDGKPVLGKVKEVAGFVQANGFDGLSFDIQTAAAKLLADLIVDGMVSPLLEAFSAERFVEKKTTGETGSAGTG